MIIGFNIIYIIDKKISSVNINIPPIHVPKPSVTVRINRSKDNYDVFVDKSYGKTKTNTPKPKLVNKISTNKQESVPIEKGKIDVVEAFGNYAAANLKKR